MIWKMIKKIFTGLMAWLIKEEKEGTKLKAKQHLNKTAVKKSTVKPTTKSNAMKGKKKAC